jgi:hypothetical protein
MPILFRTDRPRLYFPYLTVVLIAVNTVVQIASRLIPDVEVQGVYADGTTAAFTESQLIVDYARGATTPPRTPSSRTSSPTATSCISPKTCSTSGSSAA